MESTWKCDCDTFNTKPICEFCGEPPKKPQTDQIVQSVINQRDPIRPGRLPITLYYNKEGLIVLNPDATIAIQNNFDPNKDIVIIVASGMLGTGKSTWLNGILYHCQDGSNFAEFRVGHSIQSQTEGLWIYPYPLYSKSNTNIQIILLDMEGMGGIKTGDIELVKKALQRLYIVGFCIASVFTLHSQNRLDSGTIETLQQAHYVMKILKEKLNIETPTIMLFVKDADEDAIKSKDGKDFLTCVQNSFQLEDDLLNNLAIRPRFPLPNKFLDSKCTDYSLLNKSKYLENIKNFIEESTLYRKKIPGTYAPLKLMDLTKLITDLAQVINSDTFEVLFTSSIDSMILKLIEPIKEAFLEEYFQECNTLAQTCDTNMSTEDFEKKILEMRELYVQKFLEKSEKTIQKKKEDSVVLRNQIQQFNVEVKSANAKILFNQRKIADAKNEEIRQELRRQKILYEQDKEKTSEVINNLKKNLENEKKRAEIQNENARKELEKKINEAKDKGFFTKIGRLLDKVFKNKKIF